MHKGPCSSLKTENVFMTFSARPNTRLNALSGLIQITRRFARTEKKGSAALFFATVLSTEGKKIQEHGVEQFSLADSISKRTLATVVL